MNFKDKLSYYTDIINEKLEQISAVPDNRQREVYEAMRYSLTAGGKRLRPVITLAVCEMLGGDIKAALPFAAAVECIHTYSLIHDDLPCMDNDSLRRGKPTCHTVYGESAALLAGDGLLTLAFELMSGADTANAKTALQIINAVSVCAGCDGMIGGQTVDLACEGKTDTDEETLRYMHLRKTSALIRAAAVAGALAGGADSNQLSSISEFADMLGLAFQIRDDILDETGDTAVLGKPTGSDDENQKVTYVTLLGVDAAQERLNTITDKAIAALSPFGERAGFLVALAEYLITRKK